MTSTAKAAPAQAKAPLNAPTTVDVFTARAEARARLYAEGVLDLQHAVDVLQCDAECCTGLVARIGQDRVQEIIACAFALVSEELIFIDVPATDVVPDPTRANAPRGPLAASTLQAAEYLVREGDVQQLRTWLAQHSAQERAAIQEHLCNREARRCRSQRNKWTTFPPASTAGLCRSPSLRTSQRRRRRSRG